MLRRHGPIPVDDPIIARQLAEMGLRGVMPLAGLIASGLGHLQTRTNLRIILEKPRCRCWSMLVVGTASDAAIRGAWVAPGVLMNSAIGCSTRKSRCAWPKR